MKKLCDRLQARVEFETQNQKLCYEFFIVSMPHEKRNEGFPIDRLSVNIESGKYYYDMDVHEKTFAYGDDGFAAFFQKVLLGIS